MYARLKSYIEDNKLLFKAQYGFREILYSAWNFGHGDYDRNKYKQENVYISRFTPFFTILRKRLIL